MAGLRKFRPLIIPILIVAFLYWRLTDRSNTQHVNQDDYHNNAPLYQKENVPPIAPPQKPGPISDLKQNIETEGITKPEHATTEPPKPVPKKENIGREKDAKVKEEEEKEESGIVPPIVPPVPVPTPRVAHTQRPLQTNAPKLSLEYFPKLDTPAPQKYKDTQRTFRYFTLR